MLDRSLSVNPVMFHTTNDLTAHYDGLPLGASHNIVAHEDKNLIVAVGSVPRNGSVSMIDVSKFCWPVLICT